MEEIQKWILIGVEIILIVVTILHLRAENKKRKINIHKSKPYHPTSLAIILTLLFVSSFILLILLNRNPRVFQLIWDNWSIISRGVITTIVVSLLAILIGSAIGVLISLLLTLPKRKVSSLAGLIWLYETYHATMDIITNTYDTINAYIILAICYVLIVTWIAVLADYLERRWKPIIN